MSRELTKEEERKRFLGSEQAIKAADNSTELIFSEIKKICESISDEKVGLTFRFEENRRKLGVYSHVFSLVIHWHRKYANVLDDSLLWVYLYEGYMKVNSNLWSRTEPQRRTSWLFVFDLNNIGEQGWRKGGFKGEFYTVAQLAQKILDLLLENIRRQRIN